MLSYITHYFKLFLKISLVNINNSNIKFEVDYISMNDILIPLY